MPQKRTKKCKECNLEFKPFNTIQKHCSKECYSKNKPIKSSFGKQKSIPLMSKKRKIENAQYIVLRAEFLSKKENQICPITKQPAVEIHHSYSGKDRAKYFLDTSTWIAVSRDGHNWIHDNPKEARELGFLK
jgi:hypothetical protein